MKDEILEQLSATISKQESRIRNLEAVIQGLAGKFKSWEELYQDLKKPFKATKKSGKYPSYDDYTRRLNDVLGPERWHFRIHEEKHHESGSCYNGNLNISCDGVKWFEKPGVGSTRQGALIRAAEDFGVFSDGD